MPCVDGFVLPVPLDRIDEHRRLARKAGGVFMAHGALCYTECVGDDLSIPPMKEFPKMVRCREGETVVFAWITYRSKSHRDRVNKKLMNDPEMARMMGDDPPFNYKRMAMGGFRSIMDL